MNLNKFANLSVKMAGFLAEMWWKRIREELGGKKVVRNHHFAGSSGHLSSALAVFMAMMQKQISQTPRTWCSQDLQIFRRAAMTALGASPMPATVLAMAAAPRIALPALGQPQLTSRLQA
jgi:hypothetical protein